MKIAYVCYWNAFEHGGVAKKINAQTQVWRDLGHEVTTFCLSPAAENGAERVLNAQVSVFARPGQRPGATRRTLAAAKASAPDLIYLRYDHFFPTPGALLRAIPSVVELNAPPDERPGNFLVHRFSSLNRKIIERSASGFVTVAYSLAELLQHLGKPIKVVPNGVDLGDDTLPVARGARPTYAFLAGVRVAPWHGIDKILRLAKAMPDSDFMLIGLDEADVGAALPDNVSVYGRMKRADYEPVLARADVALGSVAMERAGLVETSTLKFPEYLSYGLPVVIGYEETHLRGREKPWFVLELPPGPDNVETHVEQIRAFTDQVRGRRVSREEVREIVDRRAREAQRLEFMAKIASRELR